MSSELGQENKAMSAVGTGCIVLATAMLTLPLLLRKISGPDLWWSMAIGRHLYREGEYPVGGTFSFACEYPPDYMSQTWLGDLVFFYTYQFLGGDLAMQFLRVICALSAVLLLLYASRMKSWPMALFASTFLIVGTLQKLALRKALFGYMGVVALLFLWFWIKRSESKKGVWLFIPLFVLWNHLHGSVMIGVVLLGILWVGDLIDEWRLKSRVSVGYHITLLIVLLVCWVLSRQWSIAAIAVNLVPSAPESAEESLSFVEQLKSWLRFTFRGGSDENQVGEYAFPFENWHLLYVKAYLLLLAGYLGHLILVFRRGRVSWSVELVCLAFLFLGAGYLRTMAYAFLVCIPLLCADHRGEELLRGLGRKWVGAFLLVAVGVLSSLTWYRGLHGELPLLTGMPDYDFGVGVSRRFSPLMADHVLENHPQERFLNSDLVGSHLMWAWDEKKKVFHDGRTPMYTRELLTDMRQNLARKSVEKYKLEGAVINMKNERPWLRYYLLKGWRLDAFDHTTALLVAANKSKSKSPQYLGDRAELDSLTVVEKESLMLFIWEYQKALMQGGQLEEQLAFVQAHPDLNALLPESSRTSMLNVRKILINSFGSKSSPSLAPLASLMFQSPEMHMLREAFGDEFVRRKDLESAAMQYIASFNLNQKNPRVCLKLSRVYQALGHADLAEKFSRLHIALKAEPSAK